MTTTATVPGLVYVIYCTHFTWQSLLTPSHEIQNTTDAFLLLYMIPWSIWAGIRPRQRFGFWGWYRSTSISQLWPFTNTGSPLWLLGGSFSPRENTSSEDTCSDSLSNLQCKALHANLRSIRLCCSASENPIFGYSMPRPLWFEYIWNGLHFKTTKFHLGYVSWHLTAR